MTSRKRQEMATQVVPDFGGRGLGGCDERKVFCFTTYTPQKSNITNNCHVYKDYVMKEVTFFLVMAL